MSYFTYKVIMKNYILTDFNAERQKGIDMVSVKTQVEKLNEKINKIGCLFGEIGNPNRFEISLSEATHSIKNLTFDDGKVYGCVEFFDNENGRLSDIYVNNMNCKFGIRCAGISEQYGDGRYNMRKADYLKCIVSIMNFLLLCDDEINEQKHFNTESGNNMEKTLEMYGYDMISFTEHISDEKLWEKSPKEFFSDNERYLSFFISKLNEYSKL